jgi:hypothetical protein
VEVGEKSSIELEWTHFDRLQWFRTQTTTELIGTLGGEHLDIMFCLNGAFGTDDEDAVEN